MADFAARLNRLYEVVTTPEGRPYTNDAVIAALSESAGPTVSRGYLSELRSGKKDNPTLKHVEALARFFGVDPAYFVTDEQYAAGMADELRLARAMRDADVRDIALRASRLSPAALAIVTTLIEQLSKLTEGDR